MFTKLNSSCVEALWLNIISFNSSSMKQVIIFIHILADAQLWLKGLNIISEVRQ